MTGLIIAATTLSAGGLFGRKRSALVSLAAGLFASLAVLAIVVRAGWLKGLDTTVAAWFYTHRFQGLAAADAESIYDFMGVPLHFAIVAIFCSALLSLRARSVIPFVLVIGAVGAAVVVEKTLKAVIEHPPWTPAELKHLAYWMSEYHNWFPSGHVAGVAALLGMVAVFLAPGRGHPLVTAMLISVVVAGVLVVAFLALYIGGHTFTDIIGGMILGGAFVALGAAVWRSAHRRRFRRRAGVGTNRFAESNTDYRSIDVRPENSPPPTHRDAQGLRSAIRKSRACRPWLLGQARPVAR